MPSLILCALLAVSGPERAIARQHKLPAAPPPAEASSADPGAGYTDEDVREQVRAYLGTIDTPIPASRWKALGPRAEPILHALAADRSNLPTQRAKAVDGLTAVASNRTAGLLLGLAAGEDEPLVVRLSALRGLGNLLPARKLVAQLKPLLEGAGDSRVRAGAGEVLARHVPAAACAAVKAQIAREDEEIKGQFGKALDRCFPAR